MASTLVPTVLRREMDAQPSAARATCFDCPARTSDLCSHLPEETIADLFAAAGKIHLKRGEPLVLDGDAANSAYNVVDGTLMLTRHGPDGRRQVLAFLSRGHFIGLSSDDVYHFNAEALNDVTLCRFDRGRLERLLREHPVMEKKLRHIAAKIIESALDLVFTLGRKDAVGRVSAFLVHLHDTAECVDGGVDLPMTRQDIGDHLGLTIETVSRVLSKLRREKIVALNGLHRIEFRDVERLRALADAPN